MSLIRRPAGTRAGGQFAPIVRIESDVDLTVEPSWRDPDFADLSLLIDDTDLTPDEVVEQVATGPLSALPRQEVADRVGRMLHARDEVNRWDADTAAEGVLDVPPEELPLDLAEWLDWNEPDRPGENAYPGYNLEGFTSALVIHYEEELYRLRVQAVQANRASPSPGFDAP